MPVIALLVLALAVVVGWLYWRTPAEPSAPQPSTDYDGARNQLAGLPVKGWDRLTDPLLRRTLER
jgi:predicted negative regulator of RcsB-dependent stress response